MTEDALAEYTTELADATRDCQVKAAEFEGATESRSEELEAIAKARKMISEQTSGAQSLSYGLTHTTFLMLSRTLSLRGGLAKFKAVWQMREYAKSERSLRLAKLASRVAFSMRAETSNSDDPFAKVKGLSSERSGETERLSFVISLTSWSHAACGTL